MIWKNAAKVIVLIFLNSSIVGIVGSQTETLMTDIELPTDMPLTYVDPENVTAPLGETFTVSVKVFNLTDNFYTTGKEWELGGPLPPRDTRYNYSLGNLYGLDIQFSWDHTLLEYVSHTVTIPVEDHPDGLLYEPTMVVKDEVDATAGTYWLGYVSMSPAEAFNCPDKNGTVFTMTFKVVKEGACDLRLESVDLSSVFMPGVKREIPHWVRDGQFRSPVVVTRIVSVDVGALVGEELYGPVIVGENATVRVVVRNDGAVTDTYNLTFYYGTVSFATWTNQNLAPGESKTYNQTLRAEDLERGLHAVTANATIMHEGELIIEEFPKQFRVIYTPALNISDPPSIIHVDDTVTLDASLSNHTDPDSEIMNFTWSLYEPDAPIPAFSYEGVSMSHQFAKDGTWQIVLVVKDNWGVEYDPLRPATKPYRKEISLDVEARPEPLLPWDVAILIAALVVVILLVAVYLRRRAR